MIAAILTIVGYLILALCAFVLVAYALTIAGIAGVYLFARLVVWLDDSKW